MVRMEASALTDTRDVLLVFAEGGAAVVLPNEGDCRAPLHRPLGSLVRLVITALLFGVKRADWAVYEADLALDVWAAMKRAVLPVHGVQGV